ncbi:YSC84-related protein [Pelodictyon luteolum]|uniref:Ysc84 actin-binding domain-containing protein n=1 Tax=Chlorobium luteolum (strain DSM 273 / BCRC 81028 / 2530) TaxID=319225 RepID=Q3B6H9_CHLL3|nr:hypothetical protein Plut_0162 [Pelodictyon luteolum DSM 273]
MMKMMKMALLALFLLGTVGGAAHAGWDPDEAEKGRSAVAYLKKHDPSLERFFSKAYGYAVFPDVYKGGLFLFGGGHGRGYVYEYGRLVGRSTITQLNVGPQFGGQSFTEVIFFKDRKALEDFKQGNFEINAQMTAVVVTSGIATNADYSDGVALFVLPKAGVMADATVGGQKFSYDPLQQSAAPAAVPAPAQQDVTPLQPYPGAASSSVAKPYEESRPYDDTPLEKADQGASQY